MMHTHAGGFHGMLPGSDASVDAQTILDAIGLKVGDTLLDAGAGRGYFSVPAAERVGEHGTVYAVDASSEAVAALRQAAESRSLPALRPIRADLAQRIPLDDASVDVCLLANVLHDLVAAGEGDDALKEIARVLKPGGTLALLEFKKIPDTIGPPVRIRLTPEQAETLLATHGFRSGQVSDVGPHHYLALFSRAA